MSVTTALYAARLVQNRVISRRQTGSVTMIRTTHVRQMTASSARRTADTAVTAVAMEPSCAPHTYWSTAHVA
jgi:hypothetical protein